MLVLVQLCINGCFGCLEQEKIALLRLKASFNFPDGYSLPSWNSANEESECCDWEGVKCNITTGRVIQLALNNTGYRTREYVNASLFLPFEELNYLDLSTNGIQGCIPNEEFEKLSNLEELYLRANEITDFITLEALRRLNNLEQLYLDYSSINRSFLHKAGVMTSLNVLTMSQCGLNGSLPAQGWCELKNLQELDLSKNNFEGILPACKLPRWLGNMSDLYEISMAKNLLEGPIPIELCQVLSLMFIDLSNNNLFGSIPSCFNSSGIKHVHLKKNRLSGPISSAFQNCSSLVTLNLRDNYLTGNIPDWIGNLSSLSILLLKANLLEGRIPIQLCLLHKLSMLDLSYNNFFGPIPHCLSDITFEASNHGGGQFFYEYNFKKQLIDYLETQIGNMQNWLTYVDVKPEVMDMIEVMVVNQEVEFTTKSRTYSYAWKILNYMSGIDLSCNKLAGEIPPELGSLGNIHALNLSHNNLTGPIPTTFSNLKEIESLDLSYNNLKGRIPPQLIELTYLAVFSVAYNNLSGPTPDRKAQFGTFEERSYVGNSLLCGPPLHNSCTKTEPPFTLPVNHRGEEGGGFIDIDVFYISFVVAYIMMLLGIVVVLYINPHWRQAWFNFIEECIDTCYCFVLIHCRKLSNFRLV
uniref:Leucine-rich repeat-containing N-terminal plant-type domain-containing protein n=1 Tax=Fagus sylvatica TaxID=28930 RepID=A0A2N9J5W2_FAGSY